MGYGALLSCRSFGAMSFARGNVAPVWRPTHGDETAVAFSFMLCLSVGLAVACLGGFHLFLLLTAQTTIEFHGECCALSEHCDAHSFDSSSPSSSLLLCMHRQLQ